MATDTLLFFQHDEESIKQYSAYNNLTSDTFTWRYFNVVKKRGRNLNIGGFLVLNLDEAALAGI